jgi:ring-1,2-phenylacetyl-CoA epoxidase subunit PaaE
VDDVKLVELGRLIAYESVDEFFICGPEEMIFCVNDHLMQKGIGQKKIHFELFTSSTAVKTANRSNKPADTSTPSSNITIKVDGRSMDLQIAMNSQESILDAALKQGADLPYACKGGMCCTCKARLLEGEVEMDVHWGLEQEEVEKGFILTCQSHPKTEKVVVDFDVK